MMNRLVVLIVIFGVVGSCSRSKDRNFHSETEKNQQVVLSGQLRGGAGHEILVDEMGASAFIAVDTIRVAEDGSFVSRFHSDHPAFYAFRSASTGYITLIAEPGDSLYLEAAWDTLVPYTVAGSGASEQVLRLALAHREVLDKLGQISLQVRENSGAPGFRELKKELDEQFDSLIGSFHDFSESFIRSNGSSLANLLALYNQYGPGLPVFNPESDLDVYELVDSLLYGSYGEVEAVKALHVQVGNAQALKGQSTAPVWKEGDTAPLFAADNSLGGQTSLSDFRGRYVLLSFWAAWSKPSMDENVILKELYARYHPKGFGILQVSLDDDRELWLGTIRKEQLDWDHVSDLQRWDSPVASIYHVERIPFNLLIGPDGKIVGSDLFGEDLAVKLEAIYDR